MPGIRSATRRALTAALALPLLAAALTACGYGSQAPKQEQAAFAPEGEQLSAGEVRVGYFPNLTHATALVGVEKGLIQKELGGTRLAATTFNAGPSAVEALNAGSVDIGFLGPSPSVNGYTRSHGGNLRIIGGAASGGVKLVVDPDVIRTPADVRGKRIATPQKGNTQDVALIHWIGEQGWSVDPESGKGDVSVVRSNNKVTPGAFRTGSIDGAWVPEPTASQLVALGGEVLLDEAALWPDGEFVITNIVVSQRFLAEHPDVVEAVLRGTVRTNDWIDSHPDQAKAAANRALERLSGKPLPSAVLDAAWPSIKVTDDPLAGTLRTQAAWAADAGLLADPELDGIYDLRPLNAVLAAEGRPAVGDAGLGAR
ncbi:aliphatic sulfonate ABC transporter substrate-binding protein [Streptomyces sp. NPDC048001]|uniref:aliphatic sulfonate ABC transporter substrate-binding protein n=1 Tax=unclassified Streptomyces TaxID=2593676 RepID=UPI00371AC490